MTIDPYKKLTTDEVKQMRLATGIVAVRGILASEKSQIITDTTADYRNALYHEVIHCGPGCWVEPGEKCFVLGNTLSAASENFEISFLEEKDIWAAWS